MQRRTQQYDHTILSKTSKTLTLRIPGVPESPGRVLCISSTYNDRNSVISVSRGPNFCLATNHTLMIILLLSDPLHDAYSTRYSMLERVCGTRRSANRHFQATCTVAGVACARIGDLAFADEGVANKTSGGLVLRPCFKAFF